MMSIDMDNDKNIPSDGEANYEEVASEEEIYLEETEEEVRAILIFCDASPSQDIVAAPAQNDNWEKNKPMPDDSCPAENIEEEVSHAAEDLITGDSDDPPLSEKAVSDMLRTAPVRRIG